MTRCTALLWMLLAALPVGCGIRTDGSEPMDETVRTELTRTADAASLAEAPWLRVSVRLLPPALMARNRFQGREATPEEKALAAQEYTGQLYFQLRLENREGSAQPLSPARFPEGGFAAKHSYASFEMSGSFRLSRNGGDSPASLYVWEENGGIGPYNACVVAFPRPDNLDGGVTLVWSDQLFGTGEHQFRFTQDELQQADQLELAQ